MTAAGIAYVAYFVLAIMGAATASAPLSVLGTAVYFVLAIFLYRSFWRAGPLRPRSWEIVTVSRRDFALHAKRRDCRSPDCPRADVDTFYVLSYGTP